MRPEKYTATSTTLETKEPTEQFDTKKIEIGIVSNYVKNVKLFCDMADLHIYLGHRKVV